MSDCCRPLVNRLLLAVVGTLGATGECSLEAAEVRGGETVVIKADETIADDLYVFGRQITIDGTVEGDLIAFGEQITINGTVKGDIAGAGQTVVVAGSAEDARLAGQVLKLTPKAKLVGDLLAAGFSLEAEKESTVAGDALYAGFQALFAGQIDKDLRAGLANCRLAGTVGGDVDLEVGGDQGSDAPPVFGPQPVAMPKVAGGLAIADTAVVTGKLNYLAPQEAAIDPAARLAGIEHRKPAPPQNGPAGPPQNPVVAAALDRLRHVVCVLLVGLAALVCCPRWATGWADNIRTRPGASFLGGLAGLTAFMGLLIVLLIAIILAAVLAGMASLAELMAIVLVGGFVGYAAMIVGMWLISSFLAEAMAGLAIGRFTLQSNSLATRIAALVLGVVVLALVLSIPYVGPWIGFVVFLFGLGGFCLWLVGSKPAESGILVPAVAEVPAAPAKPLKG